MNDIRMSPAPVRKSLIVKAAPQRAFTVFTGRMGTWWPRSHTIATAARADVVMEPRPGGRWYERGEDGSETEWGKVLQWDPPARVLLAWQIDGSWKYNPACVTEVEINFTSVGVNETRIELEHRYLERLGENAHAIREQLNSGWGSILDLYAGDAAAQ
jgi:Activator of Hsp90 ATPase homolog 1-like protein